jgi:zinc D-Ala-D-Ala carboxypeptidase
MFLSGPAGIAARGARSGILVALVFLSAALLGAIAGPSLGPSRASSSSPAAAPIDTARGDRLPARRQRAHDRRRGAGASRTSSRPTTRGEADGAVRSGLTVFDEDRPAVANLDPHLLRALRGAATDAARHGVELVVNSGWRSPEYQDRLLRQAVSTYGSPWNAARWVATAGTSSHVSGRAVDIGPSRATAWLSRYGAARGLCQIYRNEPWHYELRPTAVDNRCPPMYADPRHDPRMQP